MTKASRSSAKAPAAITGAKLEYCPLTGRARQYALTGVETQKTVALEQRPVPAPKPVENAIEFF